MTTLGKSETYSALSNFPQSVQPGDVVSVSSSGRVTGDDPHLQHPGSICAGVESGHPRSGNYLSREAAAYWDGRDGYGEMVSSGIYFYTLEAGTVSIHAPDVNSEVGGIDAVLTGVLQYTAHLL